MRLRLKPALKWTAISVVGLLGLLVIATFFVDEPLRRYMEKEMNAKLKGYEVRLPHAHFSLFGFSVTLKDLTVRQQANPEPPVAVFPKLRASVQWKELLRLKLVADMLVDHPTVHVNRPQLLKESKDDVPVKERGWQAALETIYPLKINLLRVEKGDITYIDKADAPPLRISQLDIHADNIRNIRSRDHVYPSPFEAHGVLFDKGRGELKGHANFLAEPFPGAHALFQLSSVPLSPFYPLVSRANLVLKGGVLATSGELEYAPTTKFLDVDRLIISGLGIDYIHTAASGGKEAKAVRNVQLAAAKAAKKPDVTVKVGRLELQDSTLAIVNRAADPDFRVFLDRANLTLTHLSSEFKDGPAHASLTGRFMGSGRTKASATFRPTTRGPDLDLKIAIDDTNLVSMNDMLRAYGHFDVVKGVFSYYSELSVKGGAVSGYVKPLFRDLDVYDKRQDRHKSVFKKLYENVVGVLADLLENTPRDEVATKAVVSGRLDDPHTSVMQVIVKLIQNAFFRAILPGFDDAATALKPSFHHRKPIERVDLTSPGRNVQPVRRR